MLQVVAAVEAALRTEEKKFVTGGDARDPLGVLISSAGGVRAGAEAGPDESPEPRVDWFPKPEDFDRRRPDVALVGTEASFSAATRVGVGGVMSVSGAGRASSGGVAGGILASREGDFGEEMTSAGGVGTISGWIAADARFDFAGVLITGTSALSSLSGAINPVVSALLLEPVSTEPFLLPNDRALLNLSAVPDLRSRADEGVELPSERRFWTAVCGVAEATDEGSLSPEETEVSTWMSAWALI